MRGKRASRRVTSSHVGAAEALDEYQYACQIGYPGLILEFHILKNVVWLDGINVPEEYRGEGVGSDIVSGICDLATQYGCEVLLLRSADEGEDERLEAFYEYLGFTEVPADEFTDYDLAIESGFHYLRY